MEFRKYEKIHRLGKDEVEGILDGTVHVEEKVDGANLSVWLGGAGEIRVGSRNNDLTKNGNEFNGAVAYCNSHPGIRKFLEENPECRLYGEWLCLSGDTIIKKVSGGKGGKGNYMTLKEMYEYQNKKENGRNTSWWARYGMPSIYSLYRDKDKILPNKIKQIVYTGKKDTLKIKTRLGFEIKSSFNHPFLTNKGFEQAKFLKVNDCVAVSNLKVEKIPRNLGIETNKILIAQNEYKKSVGICAKCKSDHSLELDHINEDFSNNEKSNWQVLCTPCHRIKSGANKKTKAHSKGYDYKFDSIVSIEEIEGEDMYDIEMEGTENEANFVANGFIVHNCKHTIDYNPTAYKKFYLFDIYHSSDGFIEPLLVQEFAQQYGIDSVPFLGTFVSPTLEQLQKLMGTSKFGDRGEGIVIKRHGFCNQFGDHAYAKIVSESFKEDNGITFGGNNKFSDTYEEMRLVNQFIDVPRVQKIMNKIQPEINTKLDMKDIPRVINSVYHDFITEEAWTIAQNKKKIDFSVLSRIVQKKAKQVFVDIINNSISVADL